MGRVDAGSDWLWINDWTAEDKDQVRIVYFRKAMELMEVPSSYPIQISAASRYKLYVNGAFVQAGPEKGEKGYGYCDPSDIAMFLQEGINVVSIEVLRYPENHLRRNDSIVHTEFPGLYVQDLTEAKLLKVGEGWKCRRAEHIHLDSEVFAPAPIHAKETVYAEIPTFGWKQADYDDQDWEDSYIYSHRDSMNACSPFLMKARNIPTMEYSRMRFQDVVCCREGKEPEALTLAWNQLLQNSTPLTMEAHTKQILEIQADGLSCGYPLWTITGGKDAVIKVLYAESYCHENPDPRFKMFPVKDDRTDYKTGFLAGNEETYHVTGLGTQEEPEIYEPYWFKTFRYLRISIETADADLCIWDFAYRSSHYPLEVKTKVKASDESFADIWKICERTLKMCMHETYVDCPYYEQLQYVMDARTEILATYTTSADDRLARQCMEAFRNSQQSNGLLKADAPTEWVNVIPGFSLYYILMVHDHMMYFGDPKLIRHHFNCIDSILEFFENSITDKGLVGKIGGRLYDEPNWSFIDWTPQWGRTAGVPTATNKGDGSLTMESLYYLLGLQRAAEMAEYIGRTQMAEEYRGRARKLKNAIREWCIGKNGLLQDGPGIDDYSTHCQLFATLTEVVDEKEGRRLLEMSIGNDEIAQCSFSMCFYLFRALEKIGWYEKANDLWDMWRLMLKHNLTTCAESPHGARSDCHGWSALLLYEMPAVYLGVKPAKPGFEEISVKPVPGHLTWAEGDVVTPRGMVHVQWTREDSASEPKLAWSMAE